jgi:hypothetical protein
MNKIIWGLFAVSFIGCSAPHNKPVSNSDLISNEHSKVATATPARLDSVELVSRAATNPPAAFVGSGWQNLFDGKTLFGWRLTPFAVRGDVEIKSGLIVLEMGSPFTGISYTNTFPKNNYELALDAMRVSGSDFFCGLTFPVGESFCSLICGGWGGAVTGLSSIDGMDASENETTSFVKYEAGRWYRIRVRVTEKKIEAWIDEKKLIDVETAGKKISLRAGEIEMSKPLGIASWETVGIFREIKMRRVEGVNEPRKAD